MFLGAALGAAACARAQSGPQVEEVSIAELRASLERKDFTAEQLVQAYLDRIERIDGSGPSLNSVIELNPDALDIARRLDQADAPQGPLHGIPILIKDNIDTADKMETTAGSLALLGAPKPAADSSVAASLRRAGAVVLGKTNLSEWANFRSFNSTSGWSGRGGQTRNPYALDRNPCGSSSGSGAAAAASLCAAAIGTETNGSVVCPSSINGIVGIKPTVGLVPQSGIIPISATQDTAGPMARTVRDAALVYEGLTGADYTSGLDAATLRGKRLGVVQNHLGDRPHVDRLMEETFAALRDEGAELVDVTMPSAKQPRLGLTVMLYEFKAGLNAYLAGRGGSVQSLEKLIEFNSENADRELPYFDQSILEAAVESGPLTDDTYLEAKEAVRKWAQDDGIDKLVADNSLDALIAPTTGPAWVIDLVSGDHGSGGSSSAAARAGYPHVTVPAGYIFGLPVGLSFFGQANTDARMIELAYAFERAVPVRHSPKYLAAAELESVRTPAADAPQSATP